jgi:hypothetical protein
MPHTVPPVSAEDRKLANLFGAPDQSWLQVDLELNRQKNTDPLGQRDADRAMREELRLPASVRGAA